MTTASTQLRALEGEIEETLSGRGTLTTLAVARKAITIAKELEKERNDALMVNVSAIRAERDTLKRRLDEAMKERHANETSADELVATIKGCKVQLEDMRAGKDKLKRQLDEAIKGLQIAHERLDRLPSQADMEDALWCAISCDEIEHTLTRITEIDKL